MEKDKLIEQMLKDKGEANNTIDLDAYARGLIDMCDKLSIQLKITWKKTNYGKAAYAGSVRIGSYHYNSLTKSPKWKATFFYELYNRNVSFMEKEGGETEEECQELIEKAFDKFMEALHK